MRRSRQGLGRGGSRASIEESDPDSDLEFDDEIFGTGEEEPLMCVGAPLRATSSLRRAVSIGWLLKPRLGP